MAHIEKNLLAYLDNELSPAEKTAVAAHLARCRACAVTLNEMRALRAGLTEVIPAAYQAVHLSPPAAQRIRTALAAERARQEQATPWQRWLASLLAGLQNLLNPMSKAAIPLTAVIFLALTASAARLPLQTGVHEMLVLGQDTFAPGTQAAVRVLVRNGESSKPIANADITVQLRQPGLAKTVYSGRTDVTGSAPIRFDVPADWQGEAELLIEASSDLGSDSLVEPIRLARSYRLLLSSDKPVYRPGETIHLRTLALGAVAGRPAANAVVQIQVTDPDGRPLLRQDLSSSLYGIAATDLPLPTDALQGQYQVQALLPASAPGAAGDTLSELSLQVSQAPLPSFRVDIAAAAPYYLPGQPVSGQLSAGYFFGKPLAGAQVWLRLLGSRDLAPAAPDATGDEPLFVLEMSGRADAAGVFPFRFDLPALSADDFAPSGLLALALEATVVDSTGDSEFGWQTLNLARQPILIDVAAEGGALRSGLENALYILTSYPDGQPAATTLEIQIASAPPIRDATSEFGLAEMRYTPRAGDTGVRQVRITATDEAGLQGAAEVSLHLDTAQETLLLRSERAVYQVGDTLALEALATGAGETVYLDVIKGGQTLLTQAAQVVKGRAVLAIDLTSDLAGTLELNAYQVTAAGDLLQDTRVALVDEPEGLQVQLATDRPQYRPGESALVSVQTQVEGRGAPAAVGLAAVNEAVYAQRQYQPGFARLYFILDKALRDSVADRALSRVAAGPALSAAQSELLAVQQQAAKASWIDYQGRGFTLSDQTADLATRNSVNQRRQAAFRQLGVGLTVVLSLAPLLLALVVVVGLRRRGVLGKAANRLLATVILLGLGGALLLAIGRTALNGRWPLPAAMIALGVVALLWLLALLGLILYSWRRRDGRGQYVALLTAAYALCLALLAIAVGQGAQLSAPWLLLLAAAFTLLWLSLLLFGWGLRLEGERRAGALTWLLALLILPLILALGAADLPGGRLIQQITGPAIYGLPGGLLIGCAAPAAAPQIAESDAQVAFQNVEAEAPAAKQALEVADQALSEPAPAAAPAEPAEMVEPEAEMAMAIESAPAAEMAAPLAAAPAAAEDSLAVAAAPAEEPVQSQAVAPTPEEAPEARAAQVTSPTPPPATPPEPTATPTPQPTATATPEPQPTATPAVAESGALGIGGGGELPAEPAPPSPEALPIIRQRFPQTLYWNPEAITDEQGRLALEIPTGDSITTWRLTALAVGREGELGSATQSLVIFQPLFLELDAPTSLSLGEEAGATVRIFNYGQEALAVTLTAQASPGLGVSLPQRAVSAPANEVILLPLRLQALAAGRQTLALSVQGEGAQDAHQAVIVVHDGQ